MSDASNVPHSPGSRRPWGLWVALIVLLLASAGAGAWWWMHRQVDWEAVYSQNNRAIAVMDAFDYSEAVPEFEKVVQMAPNWLVGHINLGIALLNAGSKDPSALPRCRSVFEEILHRDPANPHAHFCLGMLLMHEKEGTEAMQHFEAVLKVDPNDASSWYWLGSLNHKDRKERLRCFEEALKRDKHLSGALYGLAMDMRDDEKRFNTMLDEIEDLRRADWRNVSDVKYSQMGRYAEVIGRFGDRPPPPPTGPLALFQPKESLKVQLAPGANWAKAPDFGSDAVAELRRLVRTRFGATMVVLDYNGDGKPDLFLAGAVAEKGRVRDLLLRNDGDNRFTDVTTEAGLAEPRPTLGCCVGDFDNDVYADLLLTGAGVQKLFRNRGDGTFEDVTAKATLDKLSSVCLGAAFVDLDQDSDLDVLLCEFASNAEDAVKRLKGEKIAGDGLAVYLHVGAPVETRTPFDKPAPLDCKFEKSSLAGLQGATGISPVALALSDMDSDRDLDWLVLDEQAVPIVVINDRLRRFRHSVLPDNLLPAASWNGALVLDVDHDGRSDLLLLSTDKEPQLLVNHCRNAADAVEAWFKPSATNSPPLRQAVAVDLNLDSWTDVVGLSRDGMPVLLHNQGGRLVSQPEALGRDADWPRDLIALTVCPTHAAGRPDLFIWSEKDGLRLYENRDNGGQGVWVQLLGRNAIDAERGNNRLRCNADGIGVWAVGLSAGVWSGQENTTLSAGLGQSRQPLLFGIARRPDIEALILRWPDGTLQGEPEKLDTVHPPPDLSTGKLASVLQRNRLPGSCPILFAWDGRRFVFVNDFLGAGSIGETGPDGTCRPPRSEEAVAIAAEQLAPRDGQYVLKITEPMDETTYLDRLQLVVVDNPPDVRVYPEERFVTTGPPPSQQLVAFGKEIYPIVARDHRGRDVTETLRRWDRVTVDDFAKRAWIGFAEEHSIELDFGERLASFGAKDRLYLCLAGWTEYPFPESSWAAHQAGISEQWPILERQDESGRWCSLGESGFPAGMPRMMLVDVTGKLTGPRCRLRLRTNMHICWDQAFVAADCRSIEPRTTSLEVHQATLAPGRIPAEYSPDGRLPKLYDYHRGVDVPLVGQSGRLTRFGDVTELLHERDDRFVIFAPGDDLTVRFDAASLPPLRSGWKRSFVLRTAGYCKDTALSTAHGTTVEPLPFQAMRNYPYGSEQHYPNDALHQDYLRRYQTREVQANPWPRTK
jgi:tetratricopeptide (TPR) repeat protein